MIMSNLSNCKQRNSYKTKIFLLSVCLIAIILVTLFQIYASLNRIVDQQTYQFCMNLLQSSIKNENYITSSVKDIFYQIYSDRFISLLVNYKSCPSPDLLAGLKQIAIYQESNYFIDSIYVYNPMNKTFYISSSNATQAVQTVNEFYDTEIIEIVENYSDYANMQPISRQVNVSYPRMKTINVITYLHYNTLASNGTSSVLVINVCQDKLVDYIYHPFEGVYSSIDLIDDNGISQLADSDGVAFKDLSSKDYIKQALDSKEEKGFFTANIDGQTSVVCYSKAFSGYWKLIFTMNEQHLTSLYIKNGNVFDTYVFIILLSILLGFCAYMIHKLVLIYNKQQEAIKNAELEKQRTAYLAKRKLITKILYDSRYYEDQSIQEMLGKYGISISADSNYYMVLFLIDYYAEMCRTWNLSECDSIKQNIANAVQEKLINYGAKFSTYSEENTILVMLQNDYGAQDDLEQFLPKVLMYADESLNVSMSAILSRNFYNLSEISNVYSWMQAAVPYKQLFGVSSVMTYDAIEAREMQTCTYPEAKSRIIVRDVIDLNIPQALLNLKELLYELSIYSYKSFHTCLMHLAISIDEGLEILQSNNSIKDTLNTSVLVYNINSFETIDDIYRSFENNLIQIENMIVEKSNTKHEELIQKIKCMVQANYADCDFSISNIADSINMSAAYIGRLFKKYTNQTLVEYMLDIRMAAAREMLETTTLNIGIIAERVGFNNNSYFYKTFKKINGVTPNMYRYNLRLHNV